MRVPDPIVAAGNRLLEDSHRLLLRLTDGRFPRSLFGMTTVELHTIGRRSGQRRSTMLTTPVHDDTRLVLIASKGGYGDHPDWYKNLAANPDVEVTIDGRTVPMRARTATGDERKRLWAQALAAYSGYAGYQRNTDREIPVVVCEPRDAD